MSHPRTVWLFVGDAEGDDTKGVVSDRVGNRLTASVRGAAMSWPPGRLCFRCRPDR